MSASSYHQNVVLISERDAVQEQLRRDGVRTGIHYPVPCHLQAPYRRFAQEPLVVAEETAGQLLSLPLFPHITERQIEYVCDCVHKCLDQLATAVDGDGAMDRRGGAEIIGPGAIVDQSVIVGYPPSRQAAEQLTIGESPQLRSGTVIYAGSTVGARFATGHNVIIREEVRIGDDVSVWSNSVIDYGCTIGDRVKIHTNCYVAQYTELEDDVFLAPGVTIANDLYPGKRGVRRIDGGADHRGRRSDRRQRDDPAVRQDRPRRDHRRRVGGHERRPGRDDRVRQPGGGGSRRPRAAAHGIARASGLVFEVQLRVVVSRGELTMFRSESVDKVRTADSGRSATAQREEASTARAYGSSAVKRVIDVGLGMVALVLLSPVFVLVAIAVRFSSKGPVLFRQERVGRGQRPFTMLKFRTMYVGARRFGAPRLRSRDADSRRGFRGRRIRSAQAGRRSHHLGGPCASAMSLDELPQLLNVIAGSMSLVGPRPVLPWEVELLDEVDHVRFEVKPGMTGLWQVSGRSRLPMSEAFQLDREYVAQQSFLLDLKILLKTLPAVLFAGDAA